MSFLDSHWGWSIRWPTESGKVAVSRSYFKKTSISFDSRDDVCVNERFPLYLLRPDFFIPCRRFSNSADVLEVDAVEKKEENITSAIFWGISSFSDYFSTFSLVNFAAGHTTWEEVIALQANTFTKDEIWAFIAIFLFNESSNALFNARLVNTLSTKRSDAFFSPLLLDLKSI